jgi:aspartate/methionine/tyrosine aminotransferase
MNSMTDRSNHIQPFQVMALLAEAQHMEAAGRDVIHLEVGEPDFPTPEPIVEAGVQAIRQGNTRYTAALGMPILRQAIARYYAERFDVDLSPARIVVTPGASGALLLLSAARLNPGDQLMLADPGYPCNRQFARVFESHGHLVPCGPEQNYQLTPDLVRQHWTAKTRAALVATPANPTGTHLSPEALAGLATVVDELKAELWVDEIYQGLNFDGPAHTVLSVASEAVVINSFSKYFGMTGWRLGWAVVPEAWEDAFDRLAQNLFLAPSTPAQYAALAAFKPETQPILEQRRVELNERRLYLMSALKALGFGLPVNPQGAFYIYADASRYTENSLKFCLKALRDTGVAFTPGVDFGTHLAHQHVRFAYTQPLPRLTQAMERLGDWLSSSR